VEWASQAPRNPKDITMNTIERIMQDTGMERLQATRHEQQRISLARAYAETQRQRAADCLEMYRAHDAAAARAPRVRVRPVPEVWRATLRRSRCWGWRAPLVITTNANPSHGDALHDLRAMVEIVTGRAFCVRRGDVVVVAARVGVSA
jgi:hypothetical protein